MVFYLLSDINIYETSPLQYLRRVLIIVAVVYMLIISRTHIHTAIRIYHRTRDVFIRTYLS